MPDEVLAMRREVRLHAAAKVIPPRSGCMACVSQQIRVEDLGHVCLVHRARGATRLAPSACWSALARRDVALVAGYEVGALRRPRVQLRPIHRQPPRPRNHVVTRVGAGPPKIAVVARHVLGAADAVGLPDCLVMRAPLAEVWGPALQHFLTVLVTVLRPPGVGPTHASASRTLVDRPPERLAGREVVLGYGVAAHGPRVLGPGRQGLCQVGVIQVWREIAVHAPVVQLSHSRLQTDGDGLLPGDVQPVPRHALRYVRHLRPVRSRHAQDHPRSRPA
mmetsp:Transcript_49313/g.155020  ORF Transcript_49313/g.155020 Transcript_49313/m.155020 type:complete len:277 (-) Transcript_49313:60-890(-)